MGQQLQPLPQHRVNHGLIDVIAIPPGGEVPLCGLRMMHMHDAWTLVGCGDKGKVGTRDQIIGASRRRGAAALKQGQ